MLTFWKGTLLTPAPLTLQLSQTQVCTEVYKFSKAFDNVKLLGDEVGGEHTAAM